MKINRLSLGAGLLAGIICLLGVRSPAPPIVAVIGRGGILPGEQVMPMNERAELAYHTLGRLSANQECGGGRDA